MIELVDINLAKKLKTIYGVDFLYSVNEENDFTRWKELSEKRGFELDLPVGAFHREPSTFDETRYNNSLKLIGQGGMSRVNHDRTIGSITKFTPVNLNYKLRLYTYKFSEAINFERESWFNLHEAMLTVLFPVENGYNTFKMPITIESHSSPEEAQPYRKSRTYKLTIDIYVKSWIVFIRDVRLVHQIIVDSYNVVDKQNTDPENLLLEFYDGERIWS